MMSRIMWMGVGLGVGMASPGEAATVSLCPAGDGEARVVLEAIAGCVQQQVDIEASDVDWTAALPRLPRDGEEVVAVTSEHGARRLELRASEPAAAVTSALPIGAPLLPQLGARPFGVEERVAISRPDGGLVIECAAGTRPAGVVLDPGAFHLPRRAAYKLVTSHRGSDGFGLSVTKAGHDATSTWRLDAADGHGGFTPPDIGDGPIQLVVECPATGDRLELLDLRLEATPPPARAGRSAWAWEIANWRERGEQLIDAATARGIDRLHVAVEVAGGRLRDASALARFVRAAAARGIAVDLVEGDPRMVRPNGRAQAIDRARAIARYQRTAPDGARLAGVQYDIEPYVLPEFGADRAAVLAAWSDTLALLADAAGMPVDVVVPFWLAGSPEGAAALDRLAGRASRVTVMAYRTDPARVTSFAEPLLAWGARQGVPVRIALEMGRLPDEVETRFRRGRGPLLLLPVGTAVAALALRNAPVGPDAVTLHQVATARIRGSDLSFQGDEARMMAAAATLQAPLSAWSSFAGFAFHGVF